MISPALAMTRFPVALLLALLSFSSLACDRSERAAERTLRFELDARDLTFSGDLERDLFCLSADRCRPCGDFERLRRLASDFADCGLPCDVADLARDLCDVADF